MSRILIFNFDGTWNGRDDASATNILRIHNALTINNQISFYFAGPGNEDENNIVGRFLGGAFGVDTFSIRDAAFETLQSVYRQGDRLAVTGFSRGAAIARLFCSKIAVDGVNGHTPDIDFLGVFDTVFALLPFGMFQRGTLFKDLHVSKKVKHAFHAVSLNENRAAFAPNLMNEREGVTEMWFRGNHADIGGGYKNRGLADITLNWMIMQAQETANLKFDYEKNSSSPLEIHREPKPRRREIRTVGVLKNGEFTDKPAQIHESVRGIKV